MYKHIYNSAGVDITGKRLMVTKSEYGYVDEMNVPHINWGTETEICDEDGFDKTFRPFANDSAYVITDYVIPKGTVICRYGKETGRFTTIKGTNYESLGLPYQKETIEYHEYIVSLDTTVECYVTRGKVAPKFDSVGGAIQFKHKQSIKLECQDGILKEDYSWIHSDI